MKRQLLIALAIFFISLATATVVIAADNPHTSMDACPVCHVAIPSPDDARVDEFRLTRNSIDDTCKGCHADKSCALGLGRVAHPSGIDTWDRHICDGPKTLPLFKGKITCATCHFHLKPVGPDFKMVRNARFFDGQVEMSALCADCHEDYY